MKLFSRVILALVAVAGFSVQALGQTTYFWQGGITGTNAGSFSGTSQGANVTGDYNTASNWNTVQPNLFTAVGGTGFSAVPGTFDTAIVQGDLNDGTTVYGFVSFNTASPVEIDQTQQANTVAQFIVTNYYVGFDNSQIILKNINGAFTVSGNLSAVGDLIVDGGATLSYEGSSNNPLVVTNGNVVVGDSYSADFTVRGAGKGTFNLVSGAFTYDNAAPSTMYVGYNQDFVSGGYATGVVTEGTGSGTVSASALNQAVVTTGQKLYIGYNGGQGAWTLTSNSVLQTGSLTNDHYILIGTSNDSTDSYLGANYSGANGSLTLEDNSSVLLGSVGGGPTDVELGTYTINGTTDGISYHKIINFENDTFFYDEGSTGRVTQTGAGTIFSISGTDSTFYIGGPRGGTGSYNLEAGSLLLGANATDKIQVYLGPEYDTNFRYTSTFTQSGGTMVLGNAANPGASSFTLGTDSNAANIPQTATYNMNGGLAIYNGSLTVRPTATLNLNGGVLEISSNLFNGTGTLNYGNGPMAASGLATGATLVFTGGTTWNDNHQGGVLAPLSTFTLDAATGTFVTANINQNLTGAGSIVFEGTDGTHSTTETVFNLNGANTYVGSTTIAGGLLNLSSDQLYFTSGINIDSLSANGTTYQGTAAITLSAQDFAYSGTIAGNGTLILNTSATTPSGTVNTLAISSTSGFTGNVVLGANGRATKLQLFGGSVGNVGDTDPTTGVSSGSMVEIGGTFAANVVNPNNFIPPTSGTVSIKDATYTGTTLVDANYTLNAQNITGAVVNSGTLNSVKIDSNLTNNAGGLAVVPTIAGTTTSIVNSANAALYAASITTVGGAGNLTNSGTLGTIADSSMLNGVHPTLPALGTPTLTFTGSFTNTQTGGLTVFVVGNRSDLYSVTGSANVGGSLYVTGSGAATVGPQTNTVLTASGGVTIGGNGNVNDANGLQVVDESGLFKSQLESLSVSGNTKLVITTTQLPIDSYAQTYNQHQVARALDATPSGNNLKADFNAFTADQDKVFVPAALDSLSAESLQYSRSIAFENATYLVQRVDSALNAIRYGKLGFDTSGINVINPSFQTGLGRTMSSLLAYDPAAPYHQTAPNGVNYYPGGDSSSTPPPTELSPVEGSEVSPASPGRTISDSPAPLYVPAERPASSKFVPGFSEFITGDVTLQNLNQSQGVSNSAPSKASSTGGGTTAGVAFHMTSNLSAGILFDYNFTDAKTDGNGSHTKVDSYAPGIFGSFNAGGFYASSLFSYGFNQYSNSRDIPLFGVTAHSNPNGQQFLLNGDMGYDFQPVHSFIIGPTLGVTYTHLDVDQFTESGAQAATADLAVRSQSSGSIRTRFGAHAIYQTRLGSVLVQPNFTAMWQHEYLNTTSITSQFSDVNSNPFITATPNEAKDSGLIGVGLTLNFNENLAVFLNYLADVSDDNFTQTVYGGVKTKF